VIVVPQQDGGLKRYFVGAFLVFWLSGWTAGAGGMVLKVISGRFQAGDVIALAFMAFFAAFAARVVYRAFRPSVPESLRLLSDGVTYDSGIPPLQTGDYRSRNLDWKSCFQRGRMWISIGRSFNRCG